MSTAKRQTLQRTAIATAIASTDCAFTPEELLSHAQRACPGLGIATVYRAIRDMVQEGRIRGILVADNSPRYERTDVAHHHHFQCDTCGGVTPLKGCSLKEDYRLPSGFKVSSHEVIFTGICPACNLDAAVEFRGEDT